ncbi:SsgA family sporulation/cell division regulator [Streptomyces sp. NPDC004629]|uniref:SsgA family sporulation/cell division regulator n=1 Tax=Streptomyces sp. NPDC004629 TaxID=3364705 RepID=UPI0036AD51A6
MHRCHLAQEIVHWAGRWLPLSITCEFSYSARDPYAVTLIFDAEGDWPVRWVFSRDLLADGLTARTGQGDVMVWPEHRLGGPSAVWIEVGSAPRTALFEIPALPVAKWLAHSYALVPRGEELPAVDWDELTQLTE